MKLFCLGENINGHCLFLQHKGVSILVDPALDLYPILQYVPQQTIYRQKKNSQRQLENDNNYDILKANLPSSYFQNKDCFGGTKEKKYFQKIEGQTFLNLKVKYKTPFYELIDISEIDIVLISDYISFSALPYLTNSEEFKGVIYCTEPSLLLGYEYIEELIKYSESSHCENEHHNWKTNDLFSALPNGEDILRWKSLYSVDDLKKCVDKISPISLREVINVFGIFTITSLSSGLSIGSCNWVIQTPLSKVSILTASSPSTMRHPLPMDVERLKNSDAVIINGLSPYNCNVQDNMAEICRDVALTTSSGGNVLFPINSTGLIYDLMEVLHEHLNNMDMQGVPFYFISSSAKSSLAYSNIFSEWLSDVKADKVFLPEPPFDHEELVKAQRLRVIESISNTIEIRKMIQPCVVFAGDPSLRYGDACYFMNLFKNNPNNLTIFTDPNFPIQQCLLPYAPITMQLRTCIIDPRIKMHEASTLLENINPKTILMPENYIDGSFSANNRILSINTINNQHLKILTFKTHEEVDIQLTKKFERAYLSNELAASLDLFKIDSQTLATSVHAKMTLFDNKCSLLPSDVVGGENQVVGLLPIEQIVSDFMKSLHGEVHVEEKSPNTYKITIPTLNCVVQISPNSSHIETNDNEDLRLQIKDIILQHLTCL